MIREKIGRPENNKKSLKHTLTNEAYPIKWLKPQKSYFKRSSNSSTVSPEAFIKFLKRFGLSSLCFGTVIVIFRAFFSQNNVTSHLPVR